MGHTKLMNGVYAIVFAMLFVFAGCGGGDDEGTGVAPRLEVAPATLAVTTTGEFQVTSDGDWELTSNRVWCEVAPRSGRGDAKVTVTVTEESAGAETEAVVTVKRGSLSATVTVKRGSANGNPSVPVLSSPAGGATEVSVFPSFEWSISADPDHDPVTYVVSYSKDGKTWKESKPLTQCVYTMPDAPLDRATAYSWKVMAKDGRGGESTSAVGTFTTRNVGGYINGEGRQYMTHSSGKRGFRLVFVGDGFVAADFEEGGAFDVAVQEGIDGLFSFEPFATYKEYFDVYKVAAYSEEQGITDERKNIVRKTCFDVQYFDYPTMIIGADQKGDHKVYTYVKDALKINDVSLTETVIILIANENQYGGACYMPLDKKNIAICSYSKQLLDPSGTLLGNYVNILAHEVGGHAIGLLGEEYTSDGQEETTITGSEINAFREYVGVGYYGNLDLVSGQQDVKWKTYIGRPGYEAVGVYEGGQNYGKGVWRAEKLTCMDNNALYYSAPAREAIVRRIMKVTGGTFDFEDFLAKDIIRSLPPSVLPDIAVK